MRHIWESTLPCCDDASEPANHAASLTRQVPSDKICAPYLGVHVRRPFCLFGHVTPHGPAYCPADQGAKPSWSRLTVPAAQAFRRPASRPSSCAANHDARLALRLSPWRPLNRIGPEGQPGACAQAAPGASNTLTASTPGTFKGELWGCLASLC